MLKIRQKQMDLLSMNAEKRFEQQLFEHLKRNFADQIKRETSESLQLRVKLYISTARQYAITTSQDIIDFSALCILIGDNFHTEVDWAREILTNPANEAVRSLKLQEAALRFLEIK